MERAFVTAGDAASRAGASAAAGLRTVLAAVSVVAFVAYPFALRAILERSGPRAAAGALLGFLVLAFVARRVLAHEALRPLLVQHALAALAAGLALAQDRALALLLVPALPSLALLFVFAATLRSGRPMIERFARRISGAGFREEMIGHCRQATVAWCAYFAANAAVICALAVLAPLGWWALYTGVGSYLGMGATFAGEFAVRRARKRRLPPPVTSR